MEDRQRIPRTKKEECPKCGSKKVERYGPVGPGSYFAEQGGKAPQGSRGTHYVCLEKGCGKHFILRSR